MQQNVQHSDGMGKPVMVVIAPKQWEAMQALVALRENEIDKEDGLVDAKVIMDELGVSKRRLCNMISDGTIPPEMYVVLPNGKKKFFWKKIMRIEQ